MSESKKLLPVLWLEKLPTSLPNTDKQQFIEQLSEVLLEWLENNQLEKISYYLYRIDVNEYKAQKVLQAFTSNSQKARSLAELMVERQLSKPF